MLWYYVVYIMPRLITWLITSCLDPLHDRIHPAWTHYMDYYIRLWPSGQGRHTLLPWGRAAWVRSPPTPTHKNVPSFRRWRFEMKLIPFYYILS
jgi:hypothetical protein